MKRLAVILILVAMVAAAFGQRAQRRFTPVYCNDEDMNRTLSYVTEHIVFDSLTYSRLGNLQGYVRCVFNVDQGGNFTNIRIQKGLMAWIDYEILMAMNQLPPMEPFLDRKGNPTNVKRDIFFTFNSDNDNFEGPYQDYNDKTTKSIDEQRAEFYADIRNKDKKWEDFTKDNTKVALDGKTIYNPTVMPNNNQLTLDNLPPRPPVSLKLRVE